jgi:hypothetical protein
LSASFSGIPASFPFMNAFIFNVNAPCWGMPAVLSEDERTHPRLARTPSAAERILLRRAGILLGRRWVLSAPRRAVGRSVVREGEEEEGRGSSRAQAFTAPSLLPSLSSSSRVSYPRFLRWRGQRKTGPRIAARPRVHLEQRMLLELHETTGFSARRTGFAAFLLARMK